MFKTLFLIASFLCLQLANGTQIDVGTRRAWYKIGDPAPIDQTSLSTRTGEIYFQFDRSSEPKGHEAKDILGPKNNPKDYFMGYLVNASDSVFHARLQDGSLIMIQEATDSTGNWKPIEHWVYSDCGNSYFRPLELAPDHAVMVPIRRYTGTMTTQIRLRLSTGRRIIYSDSFPGSIDPAQFRKELGELEAILDFGGLNYLED